MIERDRRQGYHHVLNLLDCHVSEGGDCSVAVPRMTYLVYGGISGEVEERVGVVGENAPQHIGGTIGGTIGREGENCFREAGSWDKTLLNCFNDILICLTMACIYPALKAWSSGSYNEPSDFSVQNHPKLVISKELHCSKDYHTNWQM